MNKAVGSIFLAMAVGASVACTSPITQIRERVQETRDTEAYSKYMNDTARSNIEREKARQAPVPILSREEWAKGEAAKNEAASKK